MAKIKSKADAERFIQGFEGVGWADDYHYSMTDGEEKLVFSFSFGPDTPYASRETVTLSREGGAFFSTWKDSNGSRSQAPSSVEDPVEYAWRNRKAINATLDR